MVAAWVIFLFVVSMGVGQIQMLDWNLETVPEVSLSELDALQRSYLITPELREVFSHWERLSGVLALRFCPLRFRLFETILQTEPWLGAIELF